MIYDVAVIGAGVVGALTARELRRRGISTVILEAGADVAAGASRANSGIVHGGFDPLPGTKKAALNVRGTAAMPALCAELGVSYRPNGSLVLAFSDEETESVRTLYARGQANGVPGLSLLSRAEVLALEPLVNPAVVGALLCSSAGIVCPYGLTIAAVGNAMDNGADLLTEFRVDRIENDGAHYRIYAGERAVSARYIVNAAGLYADRVAALVGDTRYHVVPKRGEYMLLDRTEGGRATRTLFQVPSRVGKGVLVTPTADGNLLIGPTSVVQEDREDRDTTSDGLAAVRTAAARTMENIPYRQVITSFTGVRASLAESDDFIIEESPAAPRFVMALGIDSPGLSSAPAIAEELLACLGRAGLALGENPDFDPRRASYHAFREMDDAEQAAFLRKNPAYGHIVCRCEGITEGEIIAAIRRNPPAHSVDAVKRRVRAGMGRCQGGFCLSYVTDILAREWNIDAGCVTKCGPGSELLVGRTKEGL